MMNSRRDTRNNRVALFDGIEEGGIRASSLYSSGSSHEIDEHDNEQAMDGLQDRVNLLKRGNDMDSSRGVLSGTMDKFKMVTGLSFCQLDVRSDESRLLLALLL
ncbi:Bet1-like SNARE 1-1, variant 2 [Lathyrus oleraceus]|uniref:Bet1-like SNARE 1-1, variant 2 n=1 Tax=Pisum sativum TaxID=3888 RepID=A0A9D4W5Y1_PEA|nr:Bet1-like SNARE 1-1, variant 2 [Pisum sativum]